MTNKSLIKSKQALDPLPAAISDGQRIIAEGGFEMDRQRTKGMFWPASLMKLPTPISTAVLRILAKGETYMIENLRQSSGSAFRWEFDVRRK